MLESQFQIEALFRNILTALGQQRPQGFYNVAISILNAADVVNADEKLRKLNVAALLRNCLHANGIHHGYKGKSTVELLDGVEFVFRHGQRVQCGSWYHIITALTASITIVDDVLSSSSIHELTAIPDEYSEQIAAESV